MYEMMGKELKAAFGKHIEAIKECNAFLFPWYDKYGVDNQTQNRMAEALSHMMFKDNVLDKPTVIDLETR